MAKKKEIEEVKKNMGQKEDGQDNPSEGKETRQDTPPEEKESGQDTPPEEKQESRSGRIVETIVEYLRVRAGAGTHHMEVAILAEPEGAKRQHRIVKEKKGWGLLEEYQEHEDGWICLEFTRAAG